MATKEDGPPIRRIPMPRSAMDRIVLSLWLPDLGADKVKETLKAITGCFQAEVYRSTLVENERWKKLAHGST
jgi:hypothetical protein